jgi:hypothetical protein
MSDGCGGLLNCGACVAPQTCGGAGVVAHCGTGIVADAGCTPRTCGQANCGQLGDGCGGLTAVCGTCTAPDICGGAGVPSKCGHLEADGGNVPCVNLCLQQQHCDAGTTTVSGVVYAPTDADAGYGNPDPLPGALVYVPNSPVSPFETGARCEQCAASVSGSPLVHTTSAVNGAFTLSNVPCGSNIPLVIQLGRWRRQITIPSVQCCGNTALTAAQTRLPRRQGEGHPNDNIPLTALVSGSADHIECVLPKIGIAMDQYSLPSGNGRVRFYRDNGADFPGGAPASTALFDNPSELAKYDMVVIDCVGSEVRKTTAQRTNLEGYANTGGRLFTSHFGYVWLFGQPTANSFTGTAMWNAAQADPPNQDAFIDTSFMKGLTFGQWIYAVGAEAATSTMAAPKIRVNTVRHDFDAVIPPAERWVYGTANGSLPGATNPAIPLQYTFNTPTAVQPMNQCGRVLFSDFHVIDAMGGGVWPNQCTAGPMTAQEKVFEYLIFDLSSCITPYIQQCTPHTCTQQGFNCGKQADGCGGVVDCGNCPGNQVCGALTPGVCAATCVPQTCAQQGLSCGPTGDGCGNLIQCGPCTAPDTCGGAGTPGKCGRPSCMPTTCAQAMANCGALADGCGGTLDCGTCTAPDTCGGGGAPNRCGHIG